MFMYVVCVCVWGGGGVYVVCTHCMLHLYRNTLMLIWIMNQADKFFTHLFDHPLYNCMYYLFVINYECLDCVII